MYKELDQITAKYIKEGTRRQTLHRNESLNAAKFASGLKKETSDSIERVHQITNNFYLSSNTGAPTYQNSSPKKQGRTTAASKPLTDESKKWGSTLHRLTGEYYGRVSEKPQTEPNAGSSANNHVSNSREGSLAMDKLLYESNSRQNLFYDSASNSKSNGVRIPGLRPAVMVRDFNTEAFLNCEKFPRNFSLSELPMPNTLRNDSLAGIHQAKPLASKFKETADIFPFSNNNSVMLKDYTPSNRNGKDPIDLDETNYRSSFGAKKQPLYLKKSPSSQFDSTGFTATIEALNSQVTQMREERDKLSKLKSETESYYKGLVQRLSQEKTSNQADKPTPGQESERRRKNSEPERLSIPRFLDYNLSSLTTDNHRTEERLALAKESEAQEAETQRIAQLERENNQLKQKVSLLETNLNKTIEDYKALDLKYRNLKNDFSYFRKQELDHMNGSSSTIPINVNPRREYFADGKKTTTLQKVKDLAISCRSDKSIEGGFLPRAGSRLLEDARSPPMVNSNNQSITEALVSNGSSVKRSLVVAQVEGQEEEDASEEGQVISVDMQRLD